MRSWGQLKNKDLKTYASLARIGFPKSFSGKIMLVVFAGTHLPLVALVLYLLLASPSGLGTHSGVLVALLIATLLGFVAPLFALRALLAPVRLASSSLEAYLDEGRKPELPIGFSDEAGRLMADVQHARRALWHRPPYRAAQPPQGRGAPGRGSRKGQARRRDLHGGGGGRRQLQGDKRHPRPPGRRRLHPPRGPGDTAQRQGGRLAGPLGRRRVRACAVGRFRFRLARSGAGAHQLGPQAEPGAPAQGRGAGIEHQRGGAPLRGRGRSTETAGEGGRGHVRGQEGGKGVGAQRLGRQVRGALVLKPPSRKTKEFAAGHSTIPSDRPTTAPSPRPPQHRIGVPLRPRAPLGLPPANSWTRSARVCGACEASRRRRPPPPLCAQRAVSYPLQAHRGNRFRPDARGDA